MNYFALQIFCWPKIDLVSQVDLYVRENHFARCSLDDQRIFFQKGGKASFDTFFNSLSIAPWKKHCNIEDLFFHIKGQGQFLIRFGLHQLKHSHHWLKEMYLSIDGESIIPLEFWPLLQDGILYCSIEALSEGYITEGAFITQTKPTQEVKLGLIITHFNRKQYVIPAIKRLHKDLLTNPLFQHNIKLIIIDNSQNITIEEALDATLIPNLNLGGSGGFTRGLLYLKDDGSFTHCLFMDDDASCEIESIRRTYALLQFSTTKDFAIAGSLLDESKKYIQFEKGAQFDGMCHPLKSEFDLRKVKNLLKAEYDNKKIHYGGWWFFAFNISEVKAFSFPFFVRGDDSMFSIMNQFNILTMNGIASWGEHFGTKESVLVSYLDTRYHILHGLQLFEHSKMKILFNFFRLFMGQLLIYNYESARAITLAMEHVLQGPNFWIKNIDMNDTRKSIQSIIKNEKMQPQDLKIFQFKRPKKSLKESKLYKAIRLASLNGFLIPSFFLKPQIILLDKTTKMRHKHIFRYKQVLHFNSQNNTGYISKHDKIIFFKELFNFIKIALLFLASFKTLKQSYLQKLPYLTSEKFWQEIYTVNSSFPKNGPL